MKTAVAFVPMARPTELAAGVRPTTAGFTRSTLTLRVAERKVLPAASLASAKTRCAPLARAPEVTE